MMKLKPGLELFQLVKAIRKLGTSSSSDSISNYRGPATVAPFDLPTLLQILHHRVRAALGVTLGVYGFKPLFFHCVSPYVGFSVAGAPGSQSRVFLPEA